MLKKSEKLMAAGLLLMLVSGLGAGTNCAGAIAGMAVSAVIILVGLAGYEETPEEKQK